MQVPALLFALLMACASAASAAPPASVLLDELTSPELAARITAGATTILIPIGGTEQNGPHMALGKHNARARVLAEKIAHALGNALVAPVVTYVPEGNVSPPTGHMRHPGTITLPAPAYRTLLEYAARSFRAHGFRDIVFLGDSGDYQNDNRAVAAALDKEWAATPVRVHAIREYYAVPTVWFPDWLAGQGFARSEIGTHAGLADTALTLALAPALVRPDLPQSAAGVRGDPSRATAALGQAGVTAIVEQTSEAIRKATARR
jgi:creatinine amidohydrolase/Fe(II)-dependent formamide hydrolase-like protein